MMVGRGLYKMNIAMPKEINCLNFKGLFKFIERQYGQHGIDAVMNGLIENPTYLINDLANPSNLATVQKQHLTNTDIWVSNEFSVKLLHNVNRVVHEPNPLMFAGKGAVRESLSTNALFLGKLFGPHFLAKKAARINARFNRTKKVEFHKISSKELSFKLEYFPKFKVTKDVCNWNLGIYTGLLKASGVNQIQSEEKKCVLNGDGHCEFRLRWKKSGMIGRLIKNTSIWKMKHEIKQIVEEYETSLRERDSLIDDLTSSELKYRSLFENTATANAIIDSDYFISLTNSEFEKLFGHLRPKDSARWNMRDIFTSADLNISSSHLNEEQEHLNTLELELLTEQHDKKTYLCKFGRIRSSSNIIVSMIDLTEMKRAEDDKNNLKAKLARAEKMESLGLLAGGVAHDLNNVLSGIVSYPDLLLLDLPEDSHLRKPIQAIQNSGNKAAAIVKDLLTLSRRDVGDKKVVNLNKIIQDYLRSPEYQKMISFHPDVLVSFERDRKLLNIKGVSLNLTKAIMNLVTNAAESIKRSGTISITTRNRYINEDNANYQDLNGGHFVSLTISDSGIGIPQKDIERIFEPFYSKKVMGRSGTGLGMTVVWGTVHDHGGHINVESIEGQGTTFRMLFPATMETPALEKASISVDEMMGDGELILVVDDMKEQRELASSILKRLGYRVCLAPNGEKAINLVMNEGGYHLIILDMIMDPGIDGLDTFRKIIEFNPHQKAIIASGYSETRRVEEAKTLGVGAFIRKPYSIEKIGIAVKKEINRLTAHDGMGGSSEFI